MFAWRTPLERSNIVLHNTHDLSFMDSQTDMPKYCLRYNSKALILGWLNEKKYKRIIVLSKVALFMENLAGGGAEFAMVNIANYLVQNGFQVDLLLAENVIAYDDLMLPEINIIHFNKPKLYFCVIPLIKYLKREKPSALLSMLDLANIVALVSKIFLRSKTRSIVSFQNTTSLHKRSPIKKYLERLLLTIIIPRADKIIAVSNGVADDLASYINISRSRIEVICNPILPSKIFKLAELENDHPWLNDKNMPVILAIGRLNQQKDYPTLIHAFKNVLINKDARLIIMGEGELKDELEKLTKSLEIQSRVDFKGFVNNPYNYITSV